LRFNLNNSQVAVRPVFGKMRIPKRYAEYTNEFNREHLYEFGNFHRKRGLEMLRFLVEV